MLALPLIAAGAMPCLGAELCGCTLLVLQCNLDATAGEKRGEGEKEEVAATPAETTSLPQQHYHCLQVLERNSVKKQFESNKRKTPWQRSGKHCLGSWCEKERS